LVAPQASSMGPAATSASGLAIVTKVITAVMTFARSGAGVRTVSTLINGAFTTGMPIAATKSTAMIATAGGSNPSSQSGITWRTMNTDASFSGSNRATTRNAITLPRTAPRPKAAKKKPVMDALSKRSRRNEQEHEREGDSECGRVDVQDLGGADDADQEAGDGGADERGQPLRALDDAVGLGDEAFALAEELGENQPLRREIGAGQRAEQRDDAEQKAEAEHSRVIEQRDRRHHRDAQSV
jgi:hypothetical protein